MTAREPCGSRTAYRQHLDNKEPPDEACLRANRMYTTASRQRAAHARETAGWAAKQQDALFRQLLDLIAGECRRAGMLP